MTQTNKSSMDQTRNNNIFNEPGSKQVNIHTGDDMNRVSDFNEPTVEVLKSNNAKKSKQHRPKTSNNKGRSSS